MNSSLNGPYFYHFYNVGYKYYTFGLDVHFNDKLKSNMD